MNAVVFEGALQLLHLLSRPSVTLGWLLRPALPGTAVSWAVSAWCGMGTQGVSLRKQCLRVRVFDEQQVVEHLNAEIPQNL